MEEILAMQKKNSPNSPSKIKELLIQLSDTHFESEKVLQKLEENGEKINELTKEVASLKNEFEAERKILENKLHESEEKNILLKTLKDEKQNLNVTLKELEKKHSTSKYKPSLKDEQLIENGKRKHQLYKDFTGIRWQYDAPETVIEGFITNKKDFIQKILYKGDIDYKTVRESLWDLIEYSAINSSARELSKENKPMN